MIKKYVYYVSFSFDGGFGCCEVVRDSKISEFSQVISIAEEIKTKRTGKITVTNFILLREEEND